MRTLRLPALFTAGVLALLAGCQSDPSPPTGSSTSTTTPSPMPATPGSGSGAAAAGSGSATARDVAVGPGSDAGSAAQVAVAPPPDAARRRRRSKGTTSRPRRARCSRSARAATCRCPMASRRSCSTSTATARRTTGVKKAQHDYLDNWVKPATRVLRRARAQGHPEEVVVYPFAGGDLSTALTVYPDADEITTMSLEPAGDPRDLDTLRGGDLERALKKVERTSCKFLYRVNFSNTINMIDAMRGGALPTELIFALSALKIHGYEVVVAALLQAQRRRHAALPRRRRHREGAELRQGRHERRNWVVRERRAAVPQGRRPRPGLSPHPRRTSATSECKGIGRA